MLAELSYAIRCPGVEGIGPGSPRRWLSALSVIGTEVCYGIVTTLALDRAARCATREHAELIVQSARQTSPYLHATYCAVLMPPDRVLGIGSGELEVFDLYTNKVTHGTRVWSVGSPVRATYVPSGAPHRVIQEEIERAERDKLCVVGEDSVCERDQVLRLADELRRVQRRMEEST